MTQSSENVVASGSDWSRQIINWYSEGYSDAEVSAEMRLPLSAFYKQITDNAAFAKLIEYGRTLGQAFWESQMRKNLNNKTFNTAGWKYIMANKYGWSEKSETVADMTSTNVNVDQLRERVAKEVQHFIKKASPELTDVQLVLKQIAKGEA